MNLRRMSPHVPVVPHFLAMGSVPTIIDETYGNYVLRPGLAHLRGLIQPLSKVETSSNYICFVELCQSISPKSDPLD